MAVGTTIAKRLGFVPAAEVDELRRDVAVANANTGLVAESLTDLERQMAEPGWVRFAHLTEMEFSATGLIQMRAICRLMSIANPLVKRGLNLRSAYVWGQGVEITARANGQGSDGEQDVQAVVSAFLNDDGNMRAVTGAAARDRLEHALGTDGDLFIAHFTRPLTGQVQVRVIAADEITEVISNPEDSSEPWFYRRVWHVNAIDQQSGIVSPQQQERLYPCVDYRPRVRPRKLGLVDIAWDTPLLHVDVNRPQGWKRGVPDAYAAIPWARAYKEFLESWAGLMHSLARFAWRLTAKGNTKAQAQARLAQAPQRDPATGRALDVGATAITPTDATLEAIPKSGATIDAESGRPLAMMVAAALDVPVTMLLSDPGQTGARAVAETLDQPTELAMGQRRDLWAAAYQRILRYVITEAVRAPQGPLQGVIKRDPWTGQETVTLAGDTDQTIDVVFPDLDDADVAKVVQAIKAAADTGTVPPEVVLRLLLTALGVRDADTIVEAMVEDGDFQWPTGPPLGGGQSAADLQRAGQDPAGAGPGPMTPDDPADDGDPNANDGNPDQPKE
ncbi:hypothetical protein JNW88_00410 [Micromonospora sp. ATA32]|nr:hypothetical protein [Micromonospora sp. ATA32]